jgi:hypothetical protein
METPGLARYELSASSLGGRNVVLLDASAQSLRLFPHIRVQMNGAAASLVVCPCTPAGLAAAEPLVASPATVPALVVTFDSPITASVNALAPWEALAAVAKWSVQPNAIVFSSEPNAAATILEHVVQAVPL